MTSSTGSDSTVLWSAMRKVIAPVIIMGLSLVAFSVISRQIKIHVEERLPTVLALAIVLVFGIVCIVAMAAVGASRWDVKLKFRFLVAMFSLESIFAGFCWNLTDIFFWPIFMVIATWGVLGLGVRMLDTSRQQNLNV